MIGNVIYSQAMGGALVIGLGTGRCGSGSLAELLGAQVDGLCFHEMNPACVRFFGTPQPVLNSIAEFSRVLDGGDPSLVSVDLSRGQCSAMYDRLCQLQRLRLIGDVANYYLSYVRIIAERFPQVRFLCMRRDIEATVESFLWKTRIRRGRAQYAADRFVALAMRRPFHVAENPWVRHAGTRWRRSPLWDKLFPKFEAASREDAVRQYCHYYYEEAGKLAAELPASFRLVELARLNERPYQSEVLSFAGVPSDAQVLKDVHVYHR
jgi:hypothetical protein